MAHLWMLLYVLVQTGAYADIIVDEDGVCETVGSTSYLFCNTTETGNPTWAWQKGNDTSSGIHVIRKNGAGVVTQEPGFDRHDIVDDATLQINTSIKEDNGLYWCVIGGFGFSGERLIELTIVEPLTNANILVEKETGNVHGAMNLVCSSSDNDITSYVWEKDNILVDNTMVGVTLLESGRILYIPVYTEDLSGKYTCIVNNCAESFRSLSKEIFPSSDDSLLWLWTLLGICGAAIIVLLILWILRCFCRDILSQTCSCCNKCCERFDSCINKPCCCKCCQKCCQKLCIVAVKAEEEKEEAEMVANEAENKKIQEQGK